MKLGEWAAVLRAAARPMDGVLGAAAAQIIRRATSLSQGSTQFYVTQTRTGLRFTAMPPSERASRALQRAIAEQMPAVRQALADEGRGRLSRG